MEMPKEHEKMKFMHHFKEEKFPFAISADLRGLTVPRDNPPRSEFKTEIYQVHTPCGNMMNAVNSIEKLQNNICTVARKVWIISV